MRKIWIFRSVMLVVMFAAVAQVYAEEHSTDKIVPGDWVTGTPLDMGPAELGVPGVVYSNLGGPHWSAASGPGLLGFDDYDSINNADITLDRFKFIGGVTEVDMILWFDFYDSSNNFIDYFGVQFPQAGDWIWGITGFSGFILPDAGIVNIVAEINSQGRWFLGEADPTVGTEDPFYGSGAGIDPPIAHCFELSNVPEPASMVLLGLGGLALLRRRRA